MAAKDYVRVLKKIKVFQEIKKIFSRNIYRYIYIAYFRKVEAKKELCHLENITNGLINL